MGIDQSAHADPRPCISLIRIIPITWYLIWCLITLPCVMLPTAQCAEFTKSSSSVWIWFTRMYTGQTGIAQEISQRSERFVQNCVHDSSAIVRLCTRLQWLIFCTYPFYSVCLVCYLPSFRWMKDLNTHWRNDHDSYIIVYLLLVMYNCNNCKKLSSLQCLLRTTSAISQV